MPEKVERFLWPACTLAVMLAIFYFSSQDASASSAQSGWLASLLYGLVSPDTASFIVRKTAHFSIYMFLGICMSLSFRAWSFHSFPLSFLWLAWALCLLYACSDEFHQLFVSGRAGSLKDVLIDGLGSLLGCWLVFRFNRRLLQNRQ